MGQKKKARVNVRGVASLLKQLGGEGILSVKQEIGDKNGDSIRTEEQEEGNQEKLPAALSQSTSELGFVDAQRWPEESLVEEDAVDAPPAASVPADQPEEPRERPAKRRKTAHKATNASASKWANKHGKAWVDAYDATGMVPYYKTKAEVPEELVKYFYQRHRFFSLYSEPPGCLLDTEGWYSITPEAIADQIADRCRCDTVLDAFCGVGGNAIAFAKTCQRVIALDTDATRLALARHNAQIYGVADRIEFILTDFVAFAEAYLSRVDASKQSATGGSVNALGNNASSRKIDVVFLSPPWGGPSYLQGTSRPASPVKGSSGPVLPVDAEDISPTEHPTYSLASIRPLPGDELFALSRRISRNVAYYLPRNTDLAEIGALVKEEDALVKEGTEEQTARSKNDQTTQSKNGKGKAAGKGKREKIEIEEEWMGNKLKALTCYFGGLAMGQGHLFD